MVGANTDAMEGPDARYQAILEEVSAIVAAARRSAVRSVNAFITASSWLIGRRIVESEQEGGERAEYGTALIQRLSTELTRKFGRGFSRQNLQLMRLFYLTYSSAGICQTASGKSSQSTQNRICQTASGKFTIAATEARLEAILSAFPLPWSAYVRLLSVRTEGAREFYEQEALQGGWTVRQLERQINSQFYERTALSRNKAAMLAKGSTALPSDRVLPEAEIKDPFVLEFLDLKDEYSESDLEEALIQRMADFLLELGSDFCFVGRQRRLRVGNEWFRIDLLFFHRRLRCLVIIDLKIGKFTHADVGQMHLYLNYAREHWIHPGENPPVGLILCSEKDEALAKYALDGLPSKVMAAEYRTALPDEESLAREIDHARQQLGLRNGLAVSGPEQRAWVARRSQTGRAQSGWRFPGSPPGSIRE